MPIILYNIYILIHIFISYSFDSFGAIIQKSGSKSCHRQLPFFYRPFNHPKYRRIYFLQILRMFQNIVGYLSSITLYDYMANPHQHLSINFLIQI